MLRAVVIVQRRIRRSLAAAVVCGAILLFFSARLLILAGKPVLAARHGHPIGRSARGMRRSPIGRAGSIMRRAVFRAVLVIGCAGPAATCRGCDRVLAGPRVPPVLLSMRCGGMLVRMGIPFGGCCMPFGVQGEHLRRRPLLIMALAAAGVTRPAPRAGLPGSDRFILCTYSVADLRARGTLGTGPARSGKRLTQRLLKLCNARQLIKEHEASRIQSDPSASFDHMHNAGSL